MLPSYHIYEGTRYESTTHKCTTSTALRTGNPNYTAPGMEREQPVLGNQPPLPGAAMVRFIQPEDVTNNKTMVPVSYYDEDNGDNPSNYASSSNGPLLT